jgi:hypothetical protein
MSVAAPSSGKVTLETLQTYSLVDSQTGSFSTIANASKYSQDRDTMMQQSVVSPPQPIAYQGIRTGSELSINYEPSITPQVEQSKALLRNLSPFMLQIEPPLVFGEDGGFLSQSRQKSQISVGLYTNSASNPDKYAASRKAISQSGITGLNYTAAAMQQTVSQNSSGPATYYSNDMTLVDPKGSKLGQPAIADIHTALDIAQQLSAIMNAPPLVLLINPSSLSITRTKVQQFSDRSRNGYIFQAWGEEQSTLSITAKCGAFISGARGVSFASKRDSIAWQNLMNAFHFYKNNGYIYDTVGKSNAHHFVGALSIRYDQWVYYGNMNSFTYAYDESTQNGGIEFSMEFVASQIIDTAQTTYVVQPMKSPIPSLSDPRYAGIVNQSYNQPEVSVGENGVSIQGRPVGVGDAFQSLVPANAVSPFAPGYTTPSVDTLGGDRRGSAGFQIVPEQNAGRRAVDPADLRSIRPFGLTR